MANQSEAKPNVDPNSGFCHVSKTFHSLRPDFPLPPPSQPLSITDFAFSLLPSAAAPATVLVDSLTGKSLSYSLFVKQVRNLASSLSFLPKGHVAFVLSPTSLHIPVLYFSLLSLGIVISPANPLSSDSEVAHQVRLTQPVIAFATSSTAHNIPNLQYGTVLLDSPQFESMVNDEGNRGSDEDRVVVSQSDTAAILFSSGTTGRVKGVLLTHGNFISIIHGAYHMRLMKMDDDEEHRVSLFPLPLFHVFGILMLLTSVATGDTIVLMQRFDFEEMLKIVERYRITSMPVTPPLVVALTKSELVNKYDLSSLQNVGCGGAPLGKDVADNFKIKFANVEIGQVG